jgi:hypothetical protein
MGHHPVHERLDDLVELVERAIGDGQRHKRPTPRSLADAA